VSLSRQMAALGMSEENLKRVYSTFNAYSEDFRKERERHGS